MAFERFSRKRLSWLMRTSAARPFQFRFEPLDRRQVEVIGRLVEQEDVGRRGQDLRQRSAARFASRHSLRRLVARQSELLEKVTGTIGVVAGSEPRFDEGQSRRKSAEIRLLRQIANRRARLQEPGPAVGRHEPCGNLEERRFSRAVAPDQAYALARRDRQLDARQQRRAAKGQPADPSTGSAAAPLCDSNSRLARAVAPAGAGCGGWSGRAPTKMPSGRAGSMISDRR